MGEATMVKLRKRWGPYNLRFGGCESEFGLCEFVCFVVKSCV